MTIPQSYRFLTNQVDLFIRNRMNAGSSSASSEQTGGSGNVSDVGQYKSQILSCKSDISSELTKLDSSISELEGLEAPQESDYSSKDDYLEAKADYDSKMKKLADLKKQRNELQAELDKCDEILVQLEALEGQEVSQNLKDEVKAALKANESRKITALENYISLNEEAMALIKSFKQQQQTLVNDAGVIDGQIMTLQSVPEPEFSNFINVTDGTIDVEGYKKAVKEYKDAQDEILEKSKKLEDLKNKSDKIDSILQDLASADTLEDFQAKVDEYKSYDLDNISAEGVDENRTLEIVNDEISDVQTQMKSLSGEKKSLVDKVEVLNSDIAGIISEYETALGGAPKLADFVDGEGVPDVKAYNEAVQKYNNEQKKRLEDIEEKIKKIVEYENRGVEIDKQLDELDKKLNELEEEAKKLKDAEESNKVNTNNPSQYSGEWAYVKIQVSDFLEALKKGIVTPDNCMYFGVYLAQQHPKDDGSFGSIGYKINYDLTAEQRSIDSNNDGFADALIQSIENLNHNDYIYINLPYYSIQGALYKAIANDDQAGVYPEATFENGTYWGSDWDPAKNRERILRNPGQKDEDFIKGGGYPEDAPIVTRSNSGIGSSGSVNVGSIGESSSSSGSKRANSRGTTSSSSSNIYSNNWGYIKIKASALRAAGFKNPVTMPDGRTVNVGFYRASDGMKIDDGLDGRRNADDRNTTAGDDARLTAMGDEYVYVNLPYSYLVGDLLEAINNDENAGVFVDDNDHVPYIEKDGQTFLNLENVGANDKDIVKGGYSKGAVSQTNSTSSGGKSTGAVSQTNKVTSGGYSSKDWVYVRIKAKDLVASGYKFENYSRFYSATNGGRRIDDDKYNKHKNTPNGDRDRVALEGDGYVYINVSMADVMGCLYNALKNDPNAAVYGEQDFHNNATAYNGDVRYVDENKVRNLKKINI